MGLPLVFIHVRGQDFPHGFPFWFPFIKFIELPAEWFAPALEAAGNV
jgi:hypothetical protein